MSYLKKMTFTLVAMVEGFFYTVNKVLAVQTMTLTFGHPVVHSIPN